MTPREEKSPAQQSSQKAGVGRTSALIHTGFKWESPAAAVTVFAQAWRQFPGDVSEETLEQSLDSEMKRSTALAEDKQ